MLFSSLQLLITLTYVTDQSIPMTSAVGLRENDLTSILKKMSTYVCELHGCIPLLLKALE